jgi:hypothetical protein
MNNPQEPTLQWLAEQHFEEQRSLRSAEDNLFNWSSSVFLAGLGALTSLKGLATSAEWGVLWRVFLMFAVAVVIGVILSMAYLIRRNYDQNARELQQILGQIRPYPARTGTLDTELFFYLRWSALAALGGVTLVLIWMLG